MIIHFNKQTTSFHFTKIWFTSLHFTSMHFTTVYTPFFNSLHIWTFRLYASSTRHFSPHITICDLQGYVVRSSAGSCFPTVNVPYRKQYLPITLFVSLPSFYSCDHPRSGTMVLLNCPLHISKSEYSYFLSLYRYVGQ